MVLLCRTVMAGAAPTNEVAEAFSRRVRDCRATCVQVISGNDRSSGVIVSATGYVLTAAHGLAESGPTSVVLPTGRTLPAHVTALSVPADLALLRCETSGNESAFRPARVVPSPEVAVPDTGRLVFALGIPAGHDTTHPPVCRAGTIERVSDGRISSTCVLTVGDSGGPLFDAAGRLIAIHQQIGLGRNSNLHLSVPACLKALPELFPLLEPLTDPAGRENDPPVSAERLGRALPQRPVQQMLTLTATGSDRVVGYATRLRDRYAVTKASLVRPGTRLEIRIDDTPFSLSELGRVPDEDLLFLQISDRPAQAAAPPSDPAPNVRWADVVLAAPASLNPSGAAPVPSLIGCVGCTVGSARSTMGCRLEQRGAGLWITRLAADGTAADAGMRPGDQLLSINDFAVRSFADVSRSTGDLEPGDWVSFEFRRNGQRHRSSGQLRRSGRNLLARAEFLDGRAGLLSRRRSGFTRVLQHDGRLEPEQMGGPLLDASGRLLAVNIARRSRESVLAIPIGRVLRHLNSLTGPDAAEQPPQADSPSPR